MNELRNLRMDEQWELKSQTELVDYIVSHYHQNAIKDLCALIDLAEKVESAHSGHKLCPNGLVNYLNEFQIDFQEHLKKEEEVLFPIIKNGRGKFSYMPIRVMQEEHSDQFKVLSKIRELTFDLTLPKDACRTWKSLYEGVNKFEIEMKEHIYLEDSILFARALLP